MLVVILKAVVVFLVLVVVSAYVIETRLKMQAA